MHARARVDARQQISEFVARRLGLVTRAELENQFRLTRSAIDHLVRSGTLVRLHRGVYRLAAYPVSYEQAVLAACLRGLGTLASHRTAARLLGIGCAQTPIIEVSTDANLRAHGSQIVHRTTKLLPCDRSTVGPIPCTDVNRTLLDLGSVLSKAEVADALDVALVTKRTSLPRLEWRLRGPGTQGHAGTAILRELVAERRPEKAVNESVLEARFMSLIRRSALPIPCSQYEVELATGRAVRIDFAYPHARLAIELQGYRWHGGRSAWRRDLARSSALAAAGWRIIYITWDDVLHRPDEVVARIRQALFPELWHPRVP